MERTPGSIIEAKRKELLPNGRIKFSLDNLEEIAGVHRRTILHYQRGELRIPERVAEKLAKAFYEKASEQQAFIALCLKDAKLNSIEIKERGDRRRARTLVSRDCESRFRIFQEYKNDRQDVIRYSGLYFGINVIHKEENKKLFTVHTKGYEVWDWGEDFQNVEPKRLVRQQAITQLIILGRRWHGVYALIDLLTQAFDEQTDIQHQYGLDETGTVMMSERSLDFMKEKIAEIAVGKDERKRKGTAEILIADIESLKHWGEDIERSKRKLRKQLSTIESLIDAQLHRTAA